MANSRSFLLGLLETLPDERLAARCVGTGNHALWIMGHIAQSDDAVVSAFTGEPRCTPEGHATLFASKTPVSDNASDYPGRDELLNCMIKSRDRVAAWIESLDDQAALQASPEHLAPFAPYPIAAAHGVSQHEFFHAGQVATIRSSLGLPPVFR